MFTKKMLAAALCMLSGILLFAAPPSKTVEAEGFGETIAVATKNARENAVRKTFGEVVDSVAETKNEELIESTISASSGFVLSSKVIGAPKYDSANKFYVIKIQAVVATEKMKDHISRFKKSSTKIDLSSQLKASDDAEAQEKNAFKLINWFVGELPRTVTVKNTAVKLNKQNKITFSYELGTSVETVKELQNKVRTVLLGNGYTRVKPTWRYDHGGPVRYKCTGSYFLIPPADCSDIDFVKNPNEVVEAYQNSNVLLFWGPYSDYKHPQNYYHAPHTTSQFEITLVTKTGERRLLAQEKISLLNAYTDDHGKANEYCSFAPIIGPSRSGKKFFQLDRALNFQCPVEAFNDASKLEFSIISTYPDKKMQKTVLKEISLETSSIFAQQNARKNQSASLVAMLIKYHRDYHKQIQPKTEFKYERLKKAGVLKLNLSINRRGHITATRQLKQKFEDLGFNIKKLEPQHTSFISSSRSFHLGWGVVGLWYVQFDVDFDNLSSSLEKELDKYQYNVVIKFKNSKEEVLQEQKMKLPREFCPKVSRENHRTIDYVCYPNSPDYIYTMDVNFDIPEDIKSVKSVECYIEERIKQ